MEGESYMTQETNNKVEYKENKQSQHVRDSRKAKFIARISQQNYRKAKDIGTELAGLRYNYLFNDFGIPSENNQDIFCTLYFSQLRKMVDGFIPNRIALFTQVRPEVHTLYEKVDNKKSSDIWDKIRQDANRKGIDCNDCNFCDLGYFFYMWLYIKCILEINQFKDTDTLENIKSAKRVYMDTPEDLCEIIAGLRERLKKNPDLAKQIKQYIEKLTKDTLISDIKKQLENFEFVDDLDETERVETESKKTEGSTDMKSKHSAFGVQIDFDIPDFIKIKRNYSDIQEALKNDAPINIEFQNDFIVSQFRITPESLDNHKIQIRDPSNGNQFEKVQDTVSTLVILYSMANKLFGFSAESTREDVISLIQNIDNICSMVERFPTLICEYFTIQRYVEDGVKCTNVQK